MSQFPQERWSINDQSKTLLIKKLEQIRDSTPPQDLGNEIRLEVRYSFTRNYPTDALNPSGVQTMPVKPEIVERLIG